jgi:hypothetical protein
MKKFNECPKCGGKPDSIDYEPSMLIYPKGVEIEVETLVEASFKCHERKNQAVCETSVRQRDASEIKHWNTLKA